MDAEIALQVIALTLGILAPLRSLISLGLKSMRQNKIEVKVGDEKEKIVIDDIKNMSDGEVREILKRLLSDLRRDDKQGARSE